MFKRLRQKIQKIFFAGLLVTIPTMLTFFLLKFFVNYIDKVSAPLVKRFFHANLPGIGFLMTFLIVLGIGLLGTNIIGKKLVSLGEWIVSGIPLVRSIYTSAKQIVEAVLFAAEKPFQQVVLVPYPRDEVYAIGLVTRKVPREIPTHALPLATQSDEQDTTGEELFSIFIPSTPNFTGGIVIMVPRRKIIPLSMSIEDGFKYLMTGGIVAPKKPEFPEEKRPPEEWELFLH